MSFSPDGQQIVYRRWDQKADRSSLLIASSDGTGERIILESSGDDAIGDAAWSPDGKLIAYGSIKIAVRQGHCSIAGIEPLSGEIKPLSHEKWDNCFRMAWTRDGLGLVFAGTKYKEAYSTRRDQIYYISIADGESRRLTSDGNNRHQVASLGVTDSDEILVVPFNRFSQIWAMDAGGDSSSAVQITRGFADGRGGIAPISDGRIAFLTRNGDGFGVWIMNADGSERKQMTTDPPEIEELRSDKDGRFFVFSAKVDGWPHLTRVDANGGNFTQLTFGESQETDSTVSPDGNWIVYNSFVFNGSYGKSALWRIPSSGGDPFRLADTNCNTPHFSPDGNFVSCVSTDWRKLFILSMENGDTVNSIQPNGKAVLNIGSRWTPDGKALTYIVHNKNVGNIWIHPFDGGEARALTNFTSGEIYNYAFTADGARLYIARGYSSRNAVLIKNFR